MIRTRALLLAALCALASFSHSGAFARPRPDQPLVPDGAAPPVAITAGPDEGLRCATPEPGHVRNVPSMERIHEWIAEGRIAAGSAIPVAFHVISDNKGQGDIPEAWLDAMIVVLNRCYSGLDYAGNAVPGAANTGYTFYKASVDRTRSNPWYSMLPGSNHEYKAKLKLGIDPATTLNFYTAGPGYGLLGWATPPEWLASLPVWDGVVVHWASMPGGPITNYNHGGTGVHEIGHWLGLAHTFQGGCSTEDQPGCFLSGDGVCDTPSEASPAFGCPDGRDTCPSGGLDPIHNYLDYSYDQCMNQFTPGQDARMDFMMATFRPLIGASRTASADASPGGGSAARASARGGAAPRLATIDASPNPFNPRTKIALRLERDVTATLRILDVNGRVVATLAEGRRLPAGRHEFEFDGSRLSSGVYLVSLRANGAEAGSKRLLVIK